MNLIFIEYEYCLINIVRSTKEYQAILLDVIKCGGDWFVHVGACSEEVHLPTIQLPVTRL